MPSPFPGMNPFLECDVAWHDFHERFLIQAAVLIGAQVRPNFYVRIDDHIFVRESFDDPRVPTGRADLAIKSKGIVPPRAGEGVAVLEAPSRILIPVLEELREVYLEIFDRHSHRVVTVIELLSPTNKRRAGEDRFQYLAKRKNNLASDAHFVEIDLLRGGEPMPCENRPSCTYSVMVSRAEERPGAGFWPIQLSDRLPTIPIPLRTPHADATLDLQALLDQVYDGADYEQEIYDGQPHPPLNKAESAWARQYFPAIP